MKEVLVEKTMPLAVSISSLKKVMEEDA